MTMRSTSVMRSVRATLALLVLGATAASTVVAAKPIRPTRPRAMNLFSSAGYLFQVNRQQCGLKNDGEVCVAFAGSPVGGGGFWPKGTPDQYIFNSGLQVAGVVSASAGFAWAGDTSGAFFFDARGDQLMGNPLSLIYSRLVPADVSSWNASPTKTVLDANIYNPILIGSEAISQGDVFVRYWEGDPVALTGREHPMGIAVDQRILGWNFPSGNEDIIYVIYTFYNITARSSSGKYNNPSIPGPLQAEIAAIGDQFQDINENKFKIQIPDDGYTIDALYAAAAMDADVAVFSQNYATAIVPFNLGLEYSGTFLPEVGWQFPPDIFGPPFASGAGFIGIKYLRSPTDPATGKQVGLTMFSQNLNSATGFPDPVGVRQLYRYLSGFLGPSDNPCNPNAPGTVIRARRYCFLGQQQGDARFYQASGPFSLPAGQATSIVVAYINAAPLSVTGFVQGSGADTKPGTTGVGLTASPSDTARLIDRIAGWVRHTDVNGDGVISQDEVVTQPRSLLDKALVAQAVFDKGFLLPSAPDAPTFFLVPGDNQVTIVWQKSATEDRGDPFFAIASKDSVPDPADPTKKIKNVLFNPNFRQFDVEGYRIYRGRSSSQLQLVAQFDYSGTTFVDHTGEIDYGNCAPELGVYTTCPVHFDTAPPFAASNTVELAGDVIQVPPGGRVKLATGGILDLRPDSAVANQLCGDVKCPTLKNTGVGFAFVDHDVRNSFSYFYAVTAFDLNSVKSGPSSLESPRITKPVAPRKLATTASQAVLVQAVLGGDGTVLNPALDYPTIDPAKGTFNGNMPPANDGSMSIVGGLELLPKGDIVVRIDSVLPGFVSGFGAGPTMYLSVLAGGGTATKLVALPEASFSSGDYSSWDFGLAGQAIVPYDSTRARLFGVHLANTRIPISFAAQTAPLRFTSVGAALAVGRYNVGSSSNREISRYLAHSRWFDDGAQEPPDPTIVGYADSAHNAGKLTNVGRIWEPEPYRDRVSDPTTNADAAGPRGAMNINFRGYSAGAATTWYPGDFVVTWNADTSVSVFDATHHSNLPLAPNGGSGFGFINVRAFVAAGVTAGGAAPATDIDDGTGTPNINVVGYHHIYGTPPTCFPDWWAIPCITLERKAQFEPLDFNWDGVRDGDGVALMINGEVFLMEMNAIPTAGTKWHLRAVTGSMTATCAPELGPVMRACSGYTFTGPSVRPSLAPGLTYRITVQQQYTVDSTSSGSLANVHTVPDPYYVANAFEITANQKVLKFVNLPARAIIRIYSVSGVLVSVIAHDDPAGGGEATWNLRNRNNQFVASGVYFYHVEAPDGKTKIGRFTVVNFAP